MPWKRVKSSYISFVNVQPEIITSLKPVKLQIWFRACIVKYYI